MDVFTASLRSACSLRRGYFVNNLKRMAQAILQTADKPR
ncbi:gluconate 5-dehydrogenase [Yersinia pestis]|nr:gluconate 5-dehydrogenase [Yersinia pestis]